MTRFIEREGFERNGITNAFFIGDGTFRRQSQTVLEAGTT